MQYYLIASNEFLPGKGQGRQGSRASKSIISNGSNISVDYDDISYSEYTGNLNHHHHHYYYYYYSKTHLDQLF
jgi:hypothetical protein